MMALFRRKGTGPTESPTLPEDGPPERLGRILLERGQCDAVALDRARRVAAETGQRLDAVLIQLGLVSEQALAEALANLLDLPLVTATDYPEAPLFSETLLPVRFLRRARVMPIALAPSGPKLVVAVADPLDPVPAQAVGLAVGLPVTLRIAIPIELEAAFERLYAPVSSGDTEEVAGEELPLEEDSERLKDLASEAPVIRMVNQIIGRAVEGKASDIHIEPFEDRLRIRYSHDGVLHEVASPPKHLAAAIVSRIKIMAKLDIAQRRMPQDGRIKLAVRGHEIDFRVATLPALYGEAVTLRVLDRSAVVFDYEKLGLAPTIVERFTSVLQQPNGVVLVTGPTGSGKTTTLYTALLGLNEISRKIITIEDPIEYQLAGIVQSQVQPQIGLDFAALLRTLLRHAPNVVMVGEIRDVETARIAGQAALTGHLVLSTVHTNSAAATITRLRDMGLEDYLLAAVLRGVLAQRLVRRLCTHCRREEEVPPAMVGHFGLERLTDRRPMTHWRPVGCPECRKTGYRGRRAIAEFLIPDATTVGMILSRAEESDIERAAVASGMMTMLDAGLRDVLEGYTTFEEVLRNTRAEAV